MERIDLEALTEEKKNYLEEINKYFNHSGLGYIKVPTGWGKTFLAKHLMKQYYEQGKIILFLVSRNNQLLSQTAYISTGSGIPLFPNSLLLYSEHSRMDIVEMLKSSTRRNGNSNCGIVIFASLQTVTSKSNKEIRDLLGKRADLVIIDEIHNFISNRGNDFIDEIGENARILGMTATPFQGVVGHVKFVDDIAGDIREIFSKSLPQCIIDGQLSELNYVIIRSNQSILDLFDFQKGLSELDKNELYLDCGSREKIDLIVQRTHLAKRIYNDQIGNGSSKTLVFCAPIRNISQRFGDGEKKINAFHAKMCSAIFNRELTDNIDESFSFSNYTETGQFKNAVYFSSELPRKERDAILEAFRAIGRPPFILCTVGMLNEGFDFPDLENLILLRPTLSMRLYEQQVGRVTRLPRGSDKKRGNIFEIVDNIDSLYDTFKKEVFEGKNLERILMLQPENRIEELFMEGNTIEAIESGRINISEINFKSTVGESVGEYYANSVEIPPISLRARHFCKLLSMIEERTEGKFAREKEKLMQMALGFKIHDVDSAKEISKLGALLDQLEHEAYEDSRLGVNCKKHKPLVFKEVKWLLMLRALTYLKYFNAGLDSKEKGDILHILGFTGGYEQIEDHRIQCLKNGCDYNMDMSRLAGKISSLNRLSQMGFNLARQILPLIYWASCFSVDHPEIEKLFESKAWNYDVKRYVIR